MSRLFYNFFVLPLLFLFAHVAALFDRKWRAAITARYKTVKRYKEWIEKIPAERPVVYFHAASMGEFEHIKPLLQNLASEGRDNIEIVVSFFSPSAYDHVQSHKGVGLFIYLPFDFTFTWKKLFNARRPDAIMISKHDVWPNMTHTARRFNIKTFLVNASLSEKSSRSGVPSRWFLAPAYRNLEKIYAISKQDATRFENLFKCKNVIINGDTKFDQVFERKKRAEQKKRLDQSWEDATVLLYGSIWPQDGAAVLPNLEKFLSGSKKRRAIIVPHQPKKEIIDQLTSHIKKVKTGLFSENDFNASILIVDRIGLLAELYSYADIAYVGGSFKQGVHNVMEPAVYGIPVLYGPVHKNAYEAVELAEFGAGIVVKDANGFYETVERLATDSAHRKRIGEKAAEFAQKHTGATRRIMDDLKTLLKTSG